MSLAQAIIHEREDVLRQMIVMGAEINTYDEYGFTPLIETAIMNLPEYAKVLLEAGAIADFRDITGGSALHWTVENNAIDFSTMLLAAGADANAFTSAGEPVLVKPILRGHAAMKSLLVKAGAEESFAKDFINTKLLGHRFELMGEVDILTPTGKFLAINLEGFFLEFSVNLIRQSLSEFHENYLAKHWQAQKSRIMYLLAAFERAAALIQLQQYQVNLNQYKLRIHDLLSHPLLILPVAFQGHAISLVKYEHCLAICDRRNTSEFADHVTIYTIGNQSAFTESFIKKLLYEKHALDDIRPFLQKTLGLQPLSHLLIHRQIAGNCSWANVEAAIPAALFMISEDLKKPRELVDYSHGVMMFYQEWSEWDKDRALHFCLQDFSQLSQAEQAGKVALLASLFFQRLNANKKNDIVRAKRILPLLKLPEYAYVLESYQKIYHRQRNSAGGKNLMRLIDMAGDPFS